MKIFKIRKTHFLTVFVILTFWLYLIGYFRSQVHIVTQNDIPEIGEIFFADSLDRQALCFILFYVNNSNICDKMNRNLEELQNRTNDLCTYKINIAHHPGLAYKYNISGVPSVLIFRNGLEDKRIMGVVSYSNVEMIYKRHIKKADG